MYLYDCVCVYVCVIVLGHKKNLDKKKDTPFGRETKNSKKTKYIIACLTGLQVKVPDRVDGL